MAHHSCGSINIKALYHSSWSVLISRRKKTGHKGSFHPKMIKNPAGTAVSGRKRGVWKLWIRCSLATIQISRKIPISLPTLSSPATNQPYGFRWGLFGLINASGVHALYSSASYLVDQPDYIPLSRWFSIQFRPLVAALRHFNKRRVHHHYHVSHVSNRYAQFLFKIAALNNTRKRIYQDWQICHF